MLMDDGVPPVVNTCDPEAPQDEGFAAIAGLFEPAKLMPNERLYECRLNAKSDKI